MIFAWTHIQSTFAVPLQLPPTGVLNENIIITNTECVYLAAHYTLIVLLILFPTYSLSTSGLECINTVEWDIHTEGPSTRRRYLHGGDIHTEETSTRRGYTCRKDIHMNEQTRRGTCRRRDTRRDIRMKEQTQGRVYIWWSIRKVMYTWWSAHTVRQRHIYWRVYKQCNRLRATNLGRPSPRSAKS